MQLSGWSTDQADPARARRLLVGYLLGAVVVTGSLGGLVATSSGAQVNEDEGLEVVLVETPEEEPAPEKEEPAEQAPEPIELPADAIPAAAPVAPSPQAPPAIQDVDEVPEGELKDGKPDSGSNTTGDPREGNNKVGSGSANSTGTGTGAPAPPPPPPPAAPPKPDKPVKMTEDVVPPQPISQSGPAYPAAAKAAGVEGTVVVKYVVDESGNVAAARIEGGPPELHGTCLAAIKTWKFKPAMLNGNAVSVVRVARFPFRIKT